MASVGKPPKYETLEELELLIKQYFETDAFIDMGDARVFAPTVTGLAYALDLTREGLCHYGKKEQFADTIKKAKTRIGIALEQRLYGNNVTGIIFNLKNNYGWKDKQEIDNTHTVKGELAERLTGGSKR